MNKNPALELHFSSLSEIHLEKTYFNLPHFHQPIKGMRYASSAAPTGFSAFKWRSGMIAICLLFLNTKSNAMQDLLDRPVLEGLEGSVANGANIALSKPQTWFFDLFGYDTRGNPLLRRLVTIINSRFRRGKMPIKIYFKYNSFNPQNIKIFLDKSEVTDVLVLKKLISSLELQYEAKRQLPRTAKKIELLAA